MAYGLNHKLGDVLEASQREGQSDPAFQNDVTLLRQGISLQHTSLNLPKGMVNADLIVRFVGKDVNDNAIQKLKPEEYFQLVMNLVCQGVAYQKRAGIHAHKMFPLAIVTQNSAEGMETRNEINLDRVIVFDAAHYSKGQAKDITRFIFNEYGQMLSSPDLIDKDFVQAINNGELKLSCDIKGYGIWTMAPKNFKSDYVFSEKDDLHKVKEGTTRFCTDVDRNFVMPVKWGDFTVRNKGTIAARTEELLQIIEALEDVQAKRKSVLDAFYVNENNVLKARFDIYGMDPNFRIDNYDPQPQPIDSKVQTVVEAWRKKYG